MKLSQWFRLVGVSLLLVSLCACASVVSLVDVGSRRVIVTTTPPGATVTVTSKRAANPTVYTATTPATIKLPRYGGYMRGLDYSVHISMDGYQSLDREIRTQFNAWYVGNIMVGGLIGFLLVDPFTGAMYRVSPNRITATLTALPAAPAPAVEAGGLAPPAPAVTNELKRAEP